MGTRADFYIGKGEKAEWLGSIAMDGYPDGEVADPKYGPVIASIGEIEFRERVAKLIEGVRHGTKPEQGWPWPWSDSRTTDYAYAFDDFDGVTASCFGGKWFDPKEKEPESEDVKLAVFPDMKAIQKVTMGPRSGMLVIGLPGGGEAE